MMKREEVESPASCLNRAADNELLFVLRSKDKAAADTIRYWIARRVQLGLNLEHDDQLAEARRIAIDMEAQLLADIWASSAAVPVPTPDAPAVDDVSI